MKSIGVGFFMCMLLSLSVTVTALAGEKNDRNKNFTDFYFKSQIKSQAPAAGENAGSGFVVTAVPEYYRSNYGNLTTTLDGVKLKASSGHSETASLTLLASKQLTDTFELGFLYQTSYTDSSGGSLVPDAQEFQGRQDFDIIANHVGVFSNLNFKDLWTASTDLVSGL